MNVFISNKMFANHLFSIYTIQETESWKHETGSCLIQFSIFVVMLCITPVFLYEKGNQRVLITVILKTNGHLEKGAPAYAAREV